MRSLPDAERRVWLDRIVRQLGGSDADRHGNMLTWDQVRLMKGIELLVSGHSVKTVAAEVGYRQPSAFVDVFRETFGMTPRRWVAALEGRGNEGRPK